VAIPVQRKRASTPSGPDSLFEALATLSRAIGKTYDLRQDSPPPAPDAFAGEPDALERPLADLRDLALEHERLWRAEHERRRRGEALEALLPALAGALDVREVFTQVSVVAQRVLPHAFLGLGLLDEERKGIRVYATSDPVPSNMPQFLLPEEMRDEHEVEFFILRDVRLQPGLSFATARLYRAGSEEAPPIRLELDPFRRRMIEEKKVRCILRVPVRLGGQVTGFLLAAATEPDRYGADDAALATRIADHVALALAHQRLAEEARRTAEARERTARLEVRVEGLVRELESHSSHRAIGRSKKWRDALAQATKVARTQTTVLLVGESGTGKEVLARFLHRASPRAERPFVALNCAALPEQLLESELFGYEKGAFTGAAAAKPGRLEQAAGGTLFLDEVGETSPLVQAKLLRVLQEREYQRLGGTKVQKADVRLVAATNRDLRAAIARGEFREDLYYRLHVFEIRLPPLRERPEDILPLVEAFLEEIGAAVGRPAAGLSRDARERLLEHSWPGNVRELRNAIERAVILCEGGLITSEHLPIALYQPAVAGPALASLPAGGIDLEAVERDLVAKALAQARHNKSKAAKLLGLTRAQLYSRLEKYGL
jgi:transcriptional regulator with GAF, ATPase, and Fis domain